jgi:DNA replication and repair protein RecF
MLTGFRSYEALTLTLGTAPIVLTGENGAGKTNLIEALSLLGPGRGLRGASAAAFAHRAPGQEPAPQWAIAASIRTRGGSINIGTGVMPDAPERRQARRDGAHVTLSALADCLRIVWLTPAMDRIFVEGPAGRRRFLDRLTLALEPAHGTASASFEQAMRERNRLLRDGPRDPAWLSGLEAEMAFHGLAVAAARRRTVDALTRILAPGAFPAPFITLRGTLEEQLAAGQAPPDIISSYSALLAAGRARDEAAGRTLIGPHTSDIDVVHEETGQAAALCSTGEQKALLVSLVLAQARLVAELAPDACLLLLLDEIGAHLDLRRRAALFDALSALKIQAWLTGTELEPFASFGSRAQSFQLAQGRLTPV